MSGPGIALVALVMAVGLVGTFVPLLPGLLLVWLAAVGYGVVAGFGVAGWIAMTLITVLFIGGTVAKLVISKRRASAAGATRSSVVVAGAAAFIGFFLIPVVGLPVGGVAGLLVMEHRRTGDWSASWRSTKSAVIGFGIGTLLELGAGLAMVACWALWVIAGS